MRYRLVVALRVFGLVTCVMAGGCAVNSDGSISSGIRGSRAWHRSAPAQDVWAYYDKKSLEELCEQWALSHRSGILPDPVADKALLESLACRGKRLFDCGRKPWFEDPPHVRYFLEPPYDLPHRCDYPNYPPEGNSVTPANN